ncbi:50S ribosomal protein L19, chloroplastic [Canna indica]|uniref:50S ribosomal protein L19, chloroplastic n=1 Tax=Canna indica TaxID=4628 RepID=A0AAQ3QIG8_9LILI|nr:50S ribosomal protein L19, chloroplastic [Canna indica]
MGSAALLHPPLSLPIAFPRSPSPRLALFSYACPRLFASRASPRAFGSSLIRRTRESGAFVPKASSEEGEGAVGDLDSAPEGEEAPQDETAEESPAASEEEFEEKPPRKPIVKLGDIMGILNKRAIEASEKERPVPDIRTGDVVEIKLEVPENRRRASIYKGIVISKQNAGIHTTIRIRRIIAGIGVEIVFPVYSPNIKEIKVVSHRKVRRARLYYLRDKLPRLSTFK